MLDGSKVVVTVAINGGMQQDREGAIVPKQPAEIGEAAARCYKAGASIIHFHARDAQGRNSAARGIYAAVIRQIGARSPILIQTTNGIGVRRDPATGQFLWPTDSERLGLLEIEPRQDLFGIAGGSADFYSPEGGYPAETPYVNSPELLKKTIQAVYAKGSAFEYEVVEASSLHRLLRYANEGLFERDRDNVWLLHGGGFWGHTRDCKKRSVQHRRGLAPVPEGDLGRNGDRPRHVQDRHVGPIARMRSCACWPGG